MDCIFCPASLGEKTKPEHVFLQSLGGRKTTRRLVCTTCNEKAGSGPDKSLADSVAFIRNLMNYPSGTGNDPPSLRGPQIHGLKTVIKPGGIPEIVGGSPFEIITLPNGEKTVGDIVVKSAKHLQSIIPNLAAALGKSEEEVKSMIEARSAKHVSMRVPTVHHQIQLGGPEDMRSMVKTCLVLWADMYGAEELSKVGFAEAKRFVMEGSDDFARKLCTTDTRPLGDNGLLTSLYSEQINLVYVASNANGRVLGYFRLYNICGWRFELCPEGGIPNSAVGYASNPANPKDWSDDIAEKMPLTYEWIADSQREGYGVVRTSLTEMHAEYKKGAQLNEINRIYDQVLNDLGLAGNQSLTLEQTQRFVSEVVRRMVLSAQGIPSEVALTAEQLKKLINEDK